MKHLIALLLTSTFLFTAKAKEPVTPFDTSKIFCFQGHTTDTSVNLWCSMPEDLVKAGGYLYYRFSDWETTGEVYTPKVDWKFFEGTAYGRIFIQGLQPGTSYPLFFRSPKTKKKLAFEFKTYPSQMDSLQLLIGSCAMKGLYGWQKMLFGKKEYPVYRAMAREQADGMLWTGDNLYFIGESEDDEKQIKKHLLTKQVPDMQLFLKSMPQYAMWDDHDFGPNNSDGTFEYKMLSFKNFNDFWANPAPVDSNSGIYYKISYPQADIFMLDNRFLSQSNVNYLGALQTEWLKNELKASDKPFKFLVTGIQAGNKQTEHEALYRTGEWDTLISFIRENAVEGVIFLNGDRHHSEIFKHAEKGVYPVYEFTSSPLTSIGVKIKPKNPEYNNPARITGVFHESNYGKLKIVPSIKKPGTLDCFLESYDATGQLIWSVCVNSDELKW